MARGFLNKNASKHLEVLVLYFCIGGCIAGVVNRNFKQQNDILGLTSEESEMDNVEIKISVEESKEVHDPEPLIDVEVVNNTVELSSNDSNGGLLNSSSANNSSKLGNLSPPTESPNFTGNASEDSEVLSNRQFEDFHQEKDGIKLNEGNDTALGLISNETAFATTNTDFPNNTANETTAIATDFEFIGDNSSFAEVSNETDGVFQNDWSLRDFNESETRIQDFEIQFDESDSNTSLSSNDTEINHFMDFPIDMNDTIEEMSSGFISDFDDMVSNISKELQNQSSVNASEGIFSNFGFEFLKNSEVAKNAALAMEVFNFTDASLTDHIFEDGEFHGFLDLTTPSVGEDDALNSTSSQMVEFNSTDENSTNENSTGSAIVEEIIFEESNNNSLLEDENGTLSTTELMEITTNGLFENETLKLVNSTHHIGEINETSISNISVITNNTDSIENDFIESGFNNATDVIPQCPPPGFCIFWFLSQDTCAVDSHCLGSRICCRIRCSKTCIDV